MGIKCFGLVWVLILPIALLSQEKMLTLTFIPHFGKDPISFHVKYPLNDKGDSISFSSLRFYVSNIRLYKHEEIVASSKSVYLYDQNTNYSKGLKSIPATDFDHFAFDLGVDSVSNTLGAQDGDLDPINGMYWTWQSGYINFKLEGWSNICPGRKGLFTYHIGGYRSPHYNIRSVYLPVQNTSNLKINVDFKLLFTSIDLKQTSTIMSPNPESIVFADHLPSLFSTVSDDK